MLDTCNLYIDCAAGNKNYSSEQLFRILIKSDAQGCPALSVVGTDAATGLPTGLATESNQELLIEQDNEVLSSNHLQKTGGKAVDTVAYAPAYTAGDAAMLAIDKDNGGLLVNQANLSEDEDEVTAFSKATGSAVGAPTNARVLNANNTGQVIEANPCNLYDLNVVNRSGTVIIVKVYDKATAPTSADTPVFTFPVAAGDGSGRDKEWSVPMRFTNGLSVRCVTGTPDGDIGNPSTAPIIEVNYKA